MPPPILEKRPHYLELNGDVRVDEYYWLRERSNPEVTAYLTAENQYVDECLGHTRKRQETLFEEIKGRIKQTDVSVPYRDGKHLYYWRYEDGREYRIYCRQLGADTVEEVTLDVNKIAEGHSYCDVGGLKFSPDERLLGYAVDTVGRRRYDICFCDTTEGGTISDVISDVTGNFVWANDNATIFYTRQDDSTLRAYQVYRHRLGQDVSTDELVYEETDETFGCGVGKSRSQRHILIGCHQTLTTEYHVLDADHPEGPPRVFVRRKTGHEYHIDHYDDKFFVRSNAGAKNYRLLETGGEPGRWSEEHWQELVPHRDEVLLETFELFAQFLVLQERVNGLVRLCVRPWNGDGVHEITFPEPAYDAYIDAHNKVVDTTVLRFGYSSLSTPASEYDYDMVTRERTLLKCEEVLGGFQSENYRTRRLMAKTADGVQVPISLVSRYDTPLDGSSPLLLYGYGAYGISMDAYFRSDRLSLLDRGFVFAIAHVRGGEELGREWYDAGKLLKKKNTFTDFVSCAEHLIGERYTSSGRLFAMGGSAGGLLMGAVCNMRPDLFHAVVAQVPFVDVVTTMSDHTIPLTTGEFDEWGDPRDPLYYDYIKSYSPYDNVTSQAYPHLLVMAGLHDSQVQYWEPAKWVAKLRTVKTDDNLLLLKTNMDAGHSGSSGRYRRYREIALQYAFLLELVPTGTTSNTQS